VGILIKFSLIFIVLLAFIVGSSPVLGQVAPDFGARKEIISQKLKDSGFNDDEISSVFSDARIALHPEILDRTGKGFNYLSRKFGLLTKKSIMRGQRVLAENKEALREIEKKYGVEQEAILAIYRVETNLGRTRGNALVFNSLFTMSVLENRRINWAAEELVSLMILCRANDIDPFSIKGSWAGAFGLCQFIPSSYLRYAVDGDNNGVIDLFDFHDAMASIANYLREHGWQKGNHEANRKAIWAYNHCDSYVKAVLAYARASKNGKRS
jgi:membrane-bound lytic murein transglycosylase B